MMVEAAKGNWEEVDYMLSILPALTPLAQKNITESFMNANIALDMADMHPVEVEAGKDIQYLWHDIWASTHAWLASFISSPFIAKKVLQKSEELIDIQPQFSPRAWVWLAADQYSATNPIIAPETNKIKQLVTGGQYTEDELKDTFETISTITGKYYHAMHHFRINQLAHDMKFNFK